MRRPISADSPGHKYWSLLYSEKLDDFHNERWQRHNLMRVLERPPAHEGLYVCAGRFVQLAADMGWIMNHLTAALNGAKRPARALLALGSSASVAPNLRLAGDADGAYAAIGWDQLGDLSAIAVGDQVKGGPCGHCWRGSTQ